MTTASANADGALLVARGVRKRFGHTVALDDVSVEFRAGEVHALVGENGAGKSTLGKIIAGLHGQDSGEIVVLAHDGLMRPLRPGSMSEAYSAGVRIVHQELAQCPHLSVAENLCLHDLPRRGPFLDRRAMERRSLGLLSRLEPRIDVRMPLGSLAPGHRQICQIAAALDERSGASEARLIVFDEPTSSLSVAETERLLEIVRTLAAQGLSIVYVSHRMGEIFRVCDRVTVLRDGRLVATTPIGELDEPTVVEQMIGRRVEMKRGQGSGIWSETPVLEASITSHGRVRDVSFAVRPGEVVGLGGLVGSGRSEVLGAVFGLDRAAKGSVRVGGRLLKPWTARAAVEAGIGFVPEDRRLQGLCFQMGVGDNSRRLPHAARMANGLGLRSGRREQRWANEKFKELSIKAASHASLPGELSGGNQQKLLLARWMDARTKVLLLDEPTRGIDIGTKTEVHRLIREAAARGTGVLLVSSEMPELLALSDRILVMRDGALAGELSGDQMTQSNILRLAAIEARTGAA